MKSTALIDWFTFSVKGAQDPDDVITDYLHMDKNLFQDKPYGNYGYLKSKAFNGIMVYYEPGGKRVVDMGVCISMSGTGCRTFEAHSHYKSEGTPFIALAQRLHVDPAVNVSRADLAIDDRNKMLDLEVIAHAVRKGLINSRIRDRRCIDDYDVVKKAGQTIYFGAEKSSFRIRIYDKAKQMFKPGQLEYDQHWVRFEMVMREKNANGFINCLVNSENLGLLAVGIINDKLSFIERDDSNISRCSVCQWWLDFLESMDSIKLASKEATVHEIENLIDWVTQQIAPTLSLIRDAKGYFAIWDILNQGAVRRTKQQDALLEDYRNVYAVANRVPASGAAAAQGRIAP